MGVLLLEVAVSGFVLGAVMFGIGLLAIRAATRGISVPEMQRREPQPLEDLVLASV